MGGLICVDMCTNSLYCPLLASCFVTLLSISCKLVISVVIIDRKQHYHFILRNVGGGRCALWEEGVVCQGGF